MFVTNTPKSTKLTDFQIVAARASCVMCCKAVKNILPPSTGPNGSKLNNPIPRDSRYIQNIRSLNHRTTYVAQVGALSGCSIQTPNHAFWLFGFVPSVTSCTALDVTTVIVSPGIDSLNASLKSSVSLITWPFMEVIFSPTMSPASCAGGLPSMNSVMTTPSFE